MRLRVGGTTKTLAGSSVRKLFEQKTQKSSNAVQVALTECEEETFHKSKTLDRALRSNALFVLLCRARAQSAAADGARARNRFDLN